MLTEQDFQDAVDDWDAKKIAEMHKKECERLMELAFNAGREMIDDGTSDNPFYAREKQKFKNLQDFKDSLK